MDMTDVQARVDEAERRIAEVNELHRQLLKERALVRFIERELILCASVVYLAGIVFGVVLAKNWWGL